MKVAVITGGSSGIGLEIARQLAASGVRVFVLSRRTLKITSPLISFIQTDVRAIASLKVAAECIQKEVPAISFLINAAGVGGEKSLDEVSEEYYQDVFDTNVKGTIFATKIFLPLIEQNGIICQISSVAGIKGFARWSIYCASKFAIEGFSRSVREELRSRKIKLSVIRPGSVDTPFYKALSREEKKDFISTREIARSVASMCLVEPNAVIEEMVVNNAVGDL